MATAGSVGIKTRRGKRHPTAFRFARVAPARQQVLQLLLVDRLEKQQGLGIESIAVREERRARRARRLYEGH